MRLFDDVQKRTAELTESLEQQTATADVLRVIASSPDRYWACVCRDMCVLRGNCVRPSSPSVQIAGRKSTTWRASNHADGGVGQVLVGTSDQRGPRVGGRQDRPRTSRRSHIPDCLTDPEYTMHEAARLGKQRSMLGVPLLRDGVPIGVIALLRTAMKPLPKSRWSW